MVGVGGTLYSVFGTGRSEKSAGLGVRTPFGGGMFVIFADVYNNNVSEMCPWGFDSQYTHTHTYACACL